MPRPSFSDDKKKFVSALPRGEAIGNQSHMLELGWSSVRYWKVHESLVNVGRILRGRGRGGTVRRVAR
jgi:hypothetical protein